MVSEEPKVKDGQRFSQRQTAELLGVSTAVLSQIPHAVMDELNEQTLITAVRLLQTYMFARSTDWDAQDRVNVAAGLCDLARLIENDKKLK